MAAAEVKYLQWKCHDDVKNDRDQTPRIIVAGVN